MCTRAYPYCASAAIWLRNNELGRSELEIAGHSKVIGDIPLLYLHPPLDVSAVGSGVEDDVGGAAYRMITVRVKARERRIRLAAPGGRVTRDKSYKDAGSAAVRSLW